MEDSLLELDVVLPTAAFLDSVLPDRVDTAAALGDRVEFYVELPQDVALEVIA